MSKKELKKLITEAVINFLNEWPCDKSKTAPLFKKTGKNTFGLNKKDN